MLVYAAASCVLACSTSARLLLPGIRALCYKGASFYPVRRSRLSISVAKKGHSPHTDLTNTGDLERLPEVDGITGWPEMRTMRKSALPDCAHSCEVLLHLARCWSATLKHCRHQVHVKLHEKSSVQAGNTASRTL